MFLGWENNSGKFENNAINDVKQISLSHVITIIILKLFTLLSYYSTLNYFCSKLYRHQNFLW